MASETYTNELATLKLGHAVWDPNPNGLYKRVRVGDVGHFQDGFFIPLFNILLPADDVSHNKWGVPDNHERLMLPDHAVRKKSPLVPGAYHSQSVQELSASGTVDCYQAHAELSFSFTKEKGAVLVLPNLATREEALYRKKFKDHMLAHYRSWFSFAVDQCGCEIEVSDLILVTGCDIAKDWAMAAFCSSNSRASGSLGAQVPVVGFEAKFSLSAGWTTSRFVHHHWGPIKEKGMDEETEPDQCIFIRGYRVKERKFLGPKVIEAGAGPHDLGKKKRDDYDDNEDLKAPSTDEDIESLSETPMRVNLLLPLLDYMLEESEATVVIAHDEDIWPFIGDIELDSTDVRAKLKLGAPSIKLEGEFGLFLRDQGDDPIEAQLNQHELASFTDALSRDSPGQEHEEHGANAALPLWMSFDLDGDEDESVPENMELSYNLSPPPIVPSVGSSGSKLSPQGKYTQEVILEHPHAKERSADDNKWASLQSKSSVTGSNDLKMMDKTITEHLGLPQPAKVKDADLLLQELKRNKRTVAARKARIRQMKELWELEEEAEKLQNERDIWRGRAEGLEDLLRNHGIPHPTWGEFDD